MEQLIKRAPAMGLTAVLSLAAFFLRRRQLVTAFDPSGLPVSRGGLLAWFTVLAVVLFGVYALLLRRRKNYKACNSRGMAAFTLSCLACLCLLIAVFRVILDGAVNETLVRVIGLPLVALCWAITAFQRTKGKRVSPWLFLVPTVFFAVELILDFRGWGQDPVVLDYCYELFALIATMCSLLQLTGFCFDKGHRRSAVFFGLCAVYFSAASAADGGGAEMFMKFGVILWTVANLWLLLRPGKKRDM